MRSAAIGRVLEQQDDRSAIGSPKDLRLAYLNELATQEDEIAAEADKIIALGRNAVLSVTHKMLRCVICDQTARPRRAHQPPLRTQKHPHHHQPALRRMARGLPNAACVVSMVDRLMHNAEIVVLDGESYRLREAKERAEHRARQRRTAKPLATAAP